MDEIVEDLSLRSIKICHKIRFSCLQSVSLRLSVTDRQAVRKDEDRSVRDSVSKSVSDLRQIQTTVLVYLVSESEQQNQVIVILVNYAKIEELFSLA